MSNDQQLFAAVTELSKLLRAYKVPHAFYGGALRSLLGDDTPGSGGSRDLSCIVELGRSAQTPHPFRRVRDAITASHEFTTSHSTWLTSSPQIEILPSGETGPRFLDKTSVMVIRNLPFLTVSEFVRAKLKTWVIGGQSKDAQDILYMLGRFWDHIDINRIPERDMLRFVSCNGAAAPAWSAIQTKYGVGAKSSKIAYGRAA
ncbi:hypothetical protein FISHEDRAFT_45606 [Fistulina hepatica ATCC 64428]|uniref:Poly A polymerase head domain-containing protein n=1 Tax=Fistulina hepatica ATCC 64428 TaxID=1128425 RepID=A0A0D7A976_9AGAR|nr:hypothetical protein FISHEDRAFT_45606 [Fistulina hepatica ATCC 64428]